MPETIYLSERLPLVVKVAQWLTARSSERPLDLSSLGVLVPTTGAGRRLRFELVRAVGDEAGVLSPRLMTPMGFLSAAAREDVASRTDALLAWMRVISCVPFAEYPVLLSGFSEPTGSALRIGRSLMDLCSLLAEAMLTPASPEMVRLFPDQEGRWRELEALYRLYLQCLAAAGLTDPSVARINTALAGLLPAGIEDVLVVGVPDLNRVCQRQLENLEAAGVTITVLVDAPDCDEALFDAWGRPDTGRWPEKILPLRLEDVRVAADPFSEAEIVARLVGSGGAAGICVADADLLRFHDRSLFKQGLKAYDPAGKALVTFECATLSRLWLSFCATGRLADLRGLAEHPVFLGTLCRESLLSPSVALAALDELRSEYLLETLEDAVIYFDEHTGTRLAQAASLIAGVKRLRDEAGVSKSLKELAAFLRSMYGERQVDSASTAAEALGTLANLLQAIAGSPLWAPKIDEAVFCEEMKSVPVFESHAGNDIELNGWLEAPWLAHSRIVLSGCTEGALPARVVTHPFLPDSLRNAVGLHSNLQRFARDTYLLHCLLATRAPGAVKVTLSRTEIDGEPAKPSRLLFRCPDAELTARGTEPLRFRCLNAHHTRSGEDMAV